MDAEANLSGNKLFEAFNQFENSYPLKAGGEDLQVFVPKSVKKSATLQSISGDATVQKVAGGIFGRSGRTEGAYATHSVLRALPGAITEAMQELSQKGDRKTRAVSLKNAVAGGKLPTPRDIAKTLVPSGCTVEDLAALHKHASRALAVHTIRHVDTEYGITDGLLLLDRMQARLAEVVQDSPASRAGEMFQNPANLLETLNSKIGSEYTRQTEFEREADKLLQAAFTEGMKEAFCNDQHIAVILDEERASIENALLEAEENGELPTSVDLEIRQEVLAIAGESLAKLPNAGAFPLQARSKNPFVRALAQTRYDNMDSKPENAEALEAMAQAISMAANAPANRFDGDVATLSNADPDDPDIAMYRRPVLTAGSIGSVAATRNGPVGAKANAVGQDVMRFYPQWNVQIPRKGESVGVEKDSMGIVEDLSDQIKQERAIKVADVLLALVDRLGIEDGTQFEALALPGKPSPTLTEFLTSGIRDRSAELTENSVFAGAIDRLMEALPTGHALRGIGNALSQTPVFEGVSKLLWQNPAIIKSPFHPDGYFDTKAPNHPIDIEVDGSKLVIKHTLIAGHPSERHSEELPENDRLLQILTMTADFSAGGGHPVWTSKVEVKTTIDSRLINDSGLEDTRRDGAKAALAEVNRMGRLGGIEVYQPVSHDGGAGS